MAIRRDTDGYCSGVLFLILSMIVSCLNDVACKFLGNRLDSAEIIFFRFFFGFVTLLPFVFSIGSKVLKTQQLKINIIRGVFGAVSFFLCTYSVINLPLVEVTTILWSIPLFHLVLARIFLAEHVNVYRCVATLIGFLGISCITFLGHSVAVHMDWLYIAPIAAAFLFALQDVIIKKVVAKENRITMLLYFAISASCVSLIPALMVWTAPTMYELFILLLLGLGGNLIQYFIFKAFSFTDLSALAPYRYVEFLFSALFAFAFFSEIPGYNVILGALILIPSTLYLAYTEKKKKAR